MRTFRQGTNEKVRYEVDFYNILDPDDSVSTAAWTVTNGITTSLETVMGDVAYITAAGGTVDTQYTFQCVVTTAEGRKHERSFIVMVVDR